MGSSTAITLKYQEKKGGGGKLPDFRKAKGGIYGQKTVKKGTLRVIDKAPEDPPGLYRKKKACLRPEKAYLMEKRSQIRAKNHFSMKTEPGARKRMDTVPGRTRLLATRMWIRGPRRGGCLLARR